MMLMKKAVFPNIGAIADPTEAGGRLADWWQAIEADAICRETVEEYGLAVDGFMKAMGQPIINK